MKKVLLSSGLHSRKTINSVVNYGNQGNNVHRLSVKNAQRVQWNR